MRKNANTQLAYIFQNTSLVFFFVPELSAKDLHSFCLTTQYVSEKEEQFHYRPPINTGLRKE
jgi:hypothetical protein